jgi:hypothetical protein
MIKYPPTLSVQCMSSFVIAFVDFVAVVSVVSYAVCSCRCLSSFNAVVLAVASASAAVVRALVAVVAVAVVLIFPKAVANVANRIFSKRRFYRRPNNRRIKLPPTSFVQYMCSFAVGLVDVVAVVAVVSYAACSCPCLFPIDAAVVAVAVASAVVVMAPVAVVAVAVVLISPKAMADAANRIFSKRVLHRRPNNQMIKSPQLFVRSMYEFVC